MSRCIAHRTCRTAVTGVPSSSRATIARSASSSSYRSKIQSEPGEDDLALTLPELFTTLADLKRDGRRPTPSAYSDILQLASRHHLTRTNPITQGREPSNNQPRDSLAWELAKAALEDANQGRITLDGSAYHSLINFTSTNPLTLPFILKQIPREFQSSDYILHRLCRIAIHYGNVDQLLPILDEMWTRQISPNLTTMTHAVRLCCDVGLSRIALDIIAKFEADSTNGSVAPTTAWTRVLRSSAETNYYDGVETAWSRTVSSRHFTPDEGLLLSILNVAARAGKPEMVSRVLEAMSGLAIEPQEHHLVALMEAYVGAGQVPEAMQVLSTIRSVGLHPTAVTAEPILAVLSSADVLDNAFYALEDLKAKGEVIDITALNVIIEASSRLNDLQRVRANQMAASDLGVKLDIDSFNSALSACVGANHRALGDTIMKEMAEAGITPNGTTYHHMILLCTKQAKYDDAFFFLEKSKSEGYKPAREAYRALVIKCQASQDARWQLVVEEMESLGYKWVPPRPDGDAPSGAARRRPASRTSSAAA